MPLLPFGRGCLTRHGVHGSNGLFREWRESEQQRSGARSWIAGGGAPGALWTILPLAPCRGCIRAAMAGLPIAAPPTPARDPRPFVAPAPESVIRCACSSGRQRDRVHSRDVLGDRAILPRGA